MGFQRSMLHWRRGWHCAIYETCLVYWFSRDLCSIGGGVGSIWHGYMCFVLYMKLLWWNGFAAFCAQLEERVGTMCLGYICIVLYIYETDLV